LLNGKIEIVSAGCPGDVGCPVSPATTEGSIQFINGNPPRLIQSSGVAGENPTETQIKSLSQLANIKNSGLTEGTNGGLKVTGDANVVIGANKESQFSKGTTADVKLNGDKIESGTITASASEASKITLNGKDYTIPAGSTITIEGGELSKVKDGTWTKPQLDALGNKVTIDAGTTIPVGENTNIKVDSGSLTKSGDNWITNGDTEITNLANNKQYGLNSGTTITSNVNGVQSGVQFGTDFVALKNTKVLDVGAGQTLISEEGAVINRQYDKSTGEIIKTNLDNKGKAVAVKGDALKSTKTFEQYNSEIKGGNTIATQDSGKLRENSDSAIKGDGTYTVGEDKTSAEGISNENKNAKKDKGMDLWKKLGLAALIGGAALLLSSLFGGGGDEEEEEEKAETNATTSGTTQTNQTNQTIVVNCTIDSDCSLGYHCNLETCIENVICSDGYVLNQTTWECEAEPIIICNGDEDCTKEGLGYCKVETQTCVECLISENCGAVENYTCAANVCILNSQSGGTGGNTTN
jgi:hypothetical protein